MGSLVPGWDTAAHGVPPRELQDIDEGQELLKEPPKEGYFAKLEKSKTLRRASVGADGCFPGALVGTPSHLAKPLLVHSATLPAHSTTSPRTLQHSATTAPVRPPTPIRGRYVPTDWEAEIQALQSQEIRTRASLSRRSADSNVSSHSPHHQPAWWAQLDTGHLNQPTMHDHTDAVARVSMHDPEPAPAGGAAHALKGVKLDWAGSNLR